LVDVAYLEGATDWLFVVCAEAGAMKAAIAKDALAAMREAAIFEDERAERMKPLSSPAQDAHPNEKSTSPPSQLKQLERDSPRRPASAA